MVRYMPAIHIFKTERTSADLIFTTIVRINPASWTYSCIYTRMISNLNYFSKAYFTRLHF